MRNSSHRLNCTSSSTTTFGVPLTNLVVWPAVVGNVALLGLFIFRRVPRSSTNTIITNCALVELYCALSLFVTRGHAGFEKPEGTGLGARLFCVIVCGQYPTWTLVNASILNLMLITLGRYVAVVHPMFHRKCFQQGKYLVLQISLTWILAPLATLYDLFYYETQETGCVSNTGDVLMWRAIWGLFGMLVGPTLLMLCAYTALACTLLSVRTTIEVQRKRRRVTLYCFAGVVFFFVCWFPVNVFFFLHSLDSHLLDHENYKNFSYLAIANIAINPYLCLIMNPHYSHCVKKGFRRLRSIILRRELGQDINSTFVGDDDEQ